MYYSPYFSMPKWWLFLANSRKYVSRSPNFHSLSKTMPTFLLIDFNRNSSSKETLANVFLFDSNWGSFATGRMIMMDQKVSGDRLPHQSAGVGPQHTINSTWLRRRDVACQLAAGQKIHELSFFNLAQQVPFCTSLRSSPISIRSWNLKGIWCEILLGIGNLLGVIIFRRCGIFSKCQFQQREMTIVLGAVVGMSIPICLIVVHYIRILVQFPCENSLLWQAVDIGGY